MTEPNARRILIEHASLGAFMVRDTGPARIVRRRFWQRGQRGFSQALGYASYWAATLALDLEDGTGRLTSEECAEAVAAQLA